MIKFIIMIKNKLSEIMGVKRLRVSELAELTGLSRNAITNLYYDRTLSISFETINLLCMALNCDIQELFEYIPD